MRPHVYFSFDHVNDLWRATTVIDATRCVVRAHVVLVMDPAKDDVVATRIRNRLEGTSITIVLVGTNTANQPWVHFEVQQSLKRGNGLLGIYIHQIKDQSGYVSNRGPGLMMPVGTNMPYYDWDLDLKRFRNEVKAAAQQRCRPAPALLHFPSLGW